MGNILYFNERNAAKGKNGAEKLYLGIPVVKKDLLIYLEEKKLNIFQEIILKLCYKGKKSLEELNDVLKLEDLELIEYIRTELVKLNYLDKDYDLTPAGEEAVKSEVQETDIKRGSVYYNCYTGDYVPGIHIEDEKFQELEIEYANKSDKKINLGTTGNSNFQKVEFLKEYFHKKQLELRNFFEIVKLETEFLKSEKEENLYFRERLENLENVCKVKQTGETTGHLLYCLYLNDEKKTYVLESPFGREELEGELLEKLLKDEKIKEKITAEYELVTALDRSEQKDYGNKYKGIIEEINKKSQGKFRNRPNLLNALAEIYDVTCPEKESISNFTDALYKTFVEILAFYADSLIKKKTKKISEVSNIEYEEILKKKFKLRQDSTEYIYLRKKLNTDRLKKGITESVDKNLYSLLGYSMLMENGAGDEKIFKYAEERKDFFDLTGLIVKLRNSQDHHSSHKDSENEFLDIYIELRDFVIEAAEKISEVNLNQENRIEKNQKEYRKIRENSFEKLNNLEFKGTDYFRYEKELLDIETSFQIFNQLNSVSYKYRILKNIGILLEKNLKELGKYLRKDSMKHLQEMKSSYIQFEKIADQFFTEREPDDFCSEEIKTLKKHSFTLNKNKIENLFRRFEMGTLNNYAAALLYSAEEGDSVLNKFLKNIPEIFEFPFIISHYRGHNGENDFSNEKMKEIISFTYNLQRKYIDEIKKYEI